MSEDTHSDGDATLGALLDRFISDELDARPVLATALGADGGHGSLGDFSAAAILAREQDDQRWAERLAGVDTTSLSEQGKIDTDLARSGLRRRQIAAECQVWRRDPLLYLGVCLDGVYSLFLHRIFPEAELAGYAASRLNEVESVLGAAARNLDPRLVSPVIAGRALDQCRAAIGYFRHGVAADVGDDGLRVTVAEAGERAARAAEELMGLLADLKDSATGDFALGEAAYSKLLREAELLSYGADELHRRGEAAWQDLDVEMNELAGRIDPSADGWRSVVEGLSANHPATPEDMLAAYTAETAKARQFLVDRQLVTIPEGERCLVEPSAPFERPIFAVASYRLSPPLRPGLTGHFFVPFPPEEATPAEVSKRLETNNHHIIPTIAVHEAYPGHHWHLTWSKSTPHTIRHVFRSSYFSEGWALYAEKMMREQGYYADPRDELAHLDARIFRAARIIVDTGLHTGELEFEEAVHIMRTRASLTEPVARAEVGRYCAWPTQAPSYLTGSLEIERMRDGYVSGRRGDLRSFHDRLCASGSMPLGLAERALDAFGAGREGGGGGGQTGAGGVQ